MFYHIVDNVSKPKEKFLEIILKFSHLLSRVLIKEKCPNQVMFSFWTHRPVRMSVLWSWLWRLILEIDPFLSVVPSVCLSICVKSFWPFLRNGSKDLPNILHECRGQLGPLFEQDGFSEKVPQLLSRGARVKRYWVN